MNYNEYDSNGNKRSFDYSLLFTDKTYRSRLILAVYALFFLILIVFVRTGISNESTMNNSSDNINDNTSVDTNNVIDDVEEEIIEDDFKEEFSYIMTNNYNFEFIINSDSDTFVATGKRYADKYELSLTDGVDVINYWADGNSVVAYSKEQYFDTDLPYYYINYFDNNLLNKILNDSLEVSSFVYEISNEKLFSYVDKRYGSVIANKDLVNSIKVEMKNNIIVSLEFDITNLVNSLSSEPINSLKITLKYSDFNLIDDFSINL